MQSMGHPDYRYEPWPDERRREASEQAKAIIRRKHLDEMKPHMTKASHVTYARNFALDLRASGCSEVEALTLLGMAFGLYMEGTSLSHRKLEQIGAAQTRVAQIAFDAARGARLARKRAARAVR